MTDVILPGTGETIATDDIGGAKYQRMKVCQGAPGSASDVSAANPMPVGDAAGLEKLEDVRALLAAPLVTSPNDLSFLERIVLKALAKLTFTMTGLRVDTGGSSVAIASGTVTTVSNLNNGALGRNTPDGQGTQQSQQAFQSGFRRNLVLS